MRSHFFSSFQIILRRSGDILLLYKHRQCFYHNKNNYHNTCIFNGNIKTQLWKIGMRSCLFHVTLCALSWRDQDVCLFLILLENWPNLWTCSNIKYLQMCEICRAARTPRQFFREIKLTTLGTCTEYFVLCLGN
jgi:hypothetical protein